MKTYLVVNDLSHMSRTDDVIISKARAGGEKRPGAVNVGVQPENVVEGGALYSNHDA